MHLPTTGVPGEGEDWIEIQAVDNWAMKKKLVV